MAQQTRHGLYGGPRGAYAGFVAKPAAVPVFAGSPLMATGYFKPLIARAFFKPQVATAWFRPTVARANLQEVE